MPNYKIGFQIHEEIVKETIKQRLSKVNLETLKLELRAAVGL